MMKITITKRGEAFNLMAASRIINQILIKTDSVIGLSTGRTTKDIHHLLADRCRMRDMSSITFFGIDEVVNVQRSYAGSCYTMLQTEMIGALNIKEDNFLMLPTTSSSYPKACCDFQTEIEKRGGIDFLELGLGENGHLGFNQPLTAFSQETWTTSMDAELEKRIRRETHTDDCTPLYGATLGLKNIMHARNILLVAKGAHKAKMVKQMLEGEITPKIPASILQLHPSCEFLLDADAASLLTDFKQIYRRNNE
jgi:glucosamine-6-phosphate deaminase